MSRPILITFDDGFASQAKAGPELAARGFSAVLFVVTGFASGPSRYWMSWDQLRRLGATLLRSAVEATVLECAARAALDHVRDLVRARGVGDDPGPPPQLKDLGRAAQALADVRAQIEIERDLHAVAAVRLAHYARGAGFCFGRSQGSASAIGSARAA